MNLEQITTYQNFLLKNLGRASGDISGVVINIDKGGNPNIVRFEGLLDLEKNLETLNQKAQQISRGHSLG